MREILKYIVLVSVVGVLQVVIAIWVSKHLAMYIVVVFNATGLAVFAGFYLYYRSVIGKYMSLNLRYLGDNYKQPFLVRSFIGKWLLFGKGDTYFNDVKALTTYKYQKILQALAVILLGFAVIAAIILIVRYIK